jgi:hypothetical protein
LRTALQNRGLITQAYTYDNLNRLKTSNLVKDNAVYFELNGLDYDANGNIKSLTRKLQNVAVDVLTYSYKPNNFNQIDKVEDAGNPFGRRLSKAFLRPIIAKSVSLEA